MWPDPAVVTPLDEHMGLDIARSLGRKGVTVYGFDSDPGAPGRYSRYVRFIRGASLEKDEAAYIDSLVKFGKTLPRRAVLFPLSDRHVLTCSLHRSELEPYFVMVQPDHETLEGLATKDGLQRLAEECNIPSPATFEVRNRDHLVELIPRLAFPTILKPTESTYWHNPRISKMLRNGLFAGKAKVVLCADERSLLAAYDQISALDDRLIVQEAIPGEDSRLVYVSLYMDRDSKPLGLFAGSKQRVIPMGFGSASNSVSRSDPEAVRLAVSFLSQVRYRGLAGVEFKIDPRDGIRKLIEVNARFGMWDGLSVRCGVDLPFIAYRDAIGVSQQPQVEFRERVMWVDWQRDLRAAMAYQRSGKLSVRSWLASLRGEKMWAIYDRNDWAPGLVFSLVLGRKLWERLPLHAGRRRAPSLEHPN